MSGLKIDTQLRHYDLRDMATMARRIEGMGFDGVWTFEAGQDPFLPLIVAANATDTLEIGTNIAVAFGRSPFSMAQVAWDLQKASRGRFHLGIGTQVRAHIERRFSMPFDHPAERVADYMHCLRAIWDSFQNGTRPDYHGPFYRYTLINDFFDPGPIEHPHIPIYLAGVNPRMCRVAGEVADGFHAHPMHTVGYLNDVVRPAIGDGARTRGKTVDDIILQTMLWVVTGNDQRERDTALETVRGQIAFYASTPNYRPMLDYLGLPDVGRELSRMMRAGETGAMADKIPDSVVEQVAVIADSPAEAGREIAARYRGVLDRVTPYAPIPETDPDEIWQAFTAAAKAA